MKNSKLVLAVLLLLAVSLSCKLLNRTGSGGLSANDLSSIAGNLPTYDPKAPPPSPGAAAVRRLAELEPNIAGMAGDVERAEHAVMKALFDKLQLQRKAGNSTEKTSSTPFAIPGGVLTGLPMVGAAFPALIFMQGQANPTTNSAHDAGLISAMLSGWSDIFTASLTSKEAGGGVKDSSTTTTDGIKSTMSAELARGTDGSTTFGFGLRSEGIKNGVPIKTDVSAKVDGQRCPNAEGQVSFTIKVRLAAESAGTIVEQDLTAFVRAVVNDNADIASNTVEVEQATRQVKGGRQIFIQTGQTFTNDDSSSNYRGSNYREIRTSQQATAADQNINEDGLRAALTVGVTSLGSAENTWRRGGCTKIEATSPGKVSPSSTTAIPVVVRHKFDGSEVPSKLDAKLSGGKSVDPTTLAKTRGTLTYTAPGETGKSATIALTATSRRGRATLDLTASTGGGSYQIVGGAKAWQTNTAVCDIMKPFTLTGNGFTMQVSGGLSGTYTYTGPFNAHGGETYSISLPDGIGKPGTMTGGGVGCAGGKCREGTEFYRLTPIEPCN